MNTWMDTREKVFAYIKEHQMLQPGDRVVLGFPEGQTRFASYFCYWNGGENSRWTLRWSMSITGSGRKPVRMPGMWKNCVENIESHFS